MEKQLQVGLQVGRERTQKLSQLQNNIQIINRVLTKINILHSWGVLAAGTCCCVLVRAPCRAAMRASGSVVGRAVMENECSERRKRVLD